MQLLLTLQGLCILQLQLSTLKVLYTSIVMYDFKSFPRYVALFLACGLVGASQLVQQGFTPRVLRSSDGESCVVESQLDAVRSRVKSQVEGVLKESIVPKLCQSGRYENLPTRSCADIHKDCPSGYYWLSGANGEPVHTYCTSNENRCCHKNDRKWMRIGYLNMSEPEAYCPEGWRTISLPVRSCRRYTDSFINSVNYSSNGIPYSRVCGRILAYQYGTPEAFWHHTQSPSSYTIDSRYVDGISITYGSPRQHIWTFAAGLSLGNGAGCPCTNPSFVSSVQVPPFIHDNYFCETGTNATTRLNSLRFLEDNPLWDGQGCTGVSTCCDFNQPPWFCRQLPGPTTEDIEIRSMTSASSSFLELEDTPVQLIEIYVQ